MLYCRSSPPSLLLFAHCLQSVLLVETLCYSFDSDVVVSDQGIHFYTLDRNRVHNRIRHKEHRSQHSAGTLKLEIQTFNRMHRIRN